MKKTDQTKKSSKTIRSLNNEHLVAIVGGGVLGDMLGGGSPLGDMLGGRTRNPLGDMLGG
jgi:hypothetical protein